VQVQEIIDHVNIFQFVDLNDEILMNNQDNLLVVFLEKEVLHDVLLLQYDEDYFQQQLLHDVYDRFREEKDI
jgi:hypothetical protein